MLDKKAAIAACPTPVCETLPSWPAALTVRVFLAALPFHVHEFIQLLVLVRRYGYGGKKVGGVGPSFVFDMMSVCVPALCPARANAGSEAI